MSRGSPFILGLVLGTVAIGAGYLAYLEFAGDGPPVVETLLAELPEQEIGLSRALPKGARTTKCGFGQALVSAQRKTVAPVGEEPDPTKTYDFPTPETRIDAMMSATTCQRAGVPLGLDTEDLSDLIRSGPMLVRRAYSGGDRQSARGWGLRGWALGQDLVANDPIQHAVIGYRLQTVFVDAFAWWLGQPELTPEERTEASVIAAELFDRSPDPRRVAQIWAVSTMRAALQEPGVGELEDGILQSAVADAAAWWKAIGDAAATPGAPVPALPTAEEPNPLLAALYDERGSDFVEAYRTAARARVAALMVYNAELSADDVCAAPWSGDPPVDPVSGAEASWDETTCILVLGDRTYETRFTAQ
ncbi:MAG: hypothetical protein AB8H79_09620 [Myxococcota bacterium]